MSVPVQIGNCDVLLPSYPVICSSFRQIVQDINDISSGLTHLSAQRAQSQTLIATLMRERDTLQQTQDRLQRDLDALQQQPRGTGNTQREDQLAARITDLQTQVNAKDTEIAETKRAVAVLQAFVEETRNKTRALKTQMDDTARQNVSNQRQPGEQRSPSDQGQPVKSVSPDLISQLLAAAPGGSARVSPAPSPRHAGSMHVSPAAIVKRKREESPVAETGVRKRQLPIMVKNRRTVRATPPQQNATPVRQNTPQKQSRRQKIFSRRTLLEKINEMVHGEAKDNQVEWDEMRKQAIVTLDAHTKKYETDDVRAMRAWLKDPRNTYADRQKFNEMDPVKIVRGMQ